ncbi:MAG: hypothetical protein WAU78_17725 [Roseiarcus sp.]|jgi:hypothetical protein
MTEPKAGDLPNAAPPMDGSAKGGAIGNPSADASGQIARRHHIDHIVARPGRLSEAERAQGAAILEREFGDYERFRRSLPKEEPPTKLPKTIPVWLAGAKKPIDLVDFLNQTLAHVGYAPIGRLAYDSMNVLGFRALWSSPIVEHFIEFGATGRPNEYLQASVSLRHPPADAFANEAQLRLLPAAYREVYAQQPPWQCKMHFDLGQQAAWEARSRLDSVEYSATALAQRIEESIRTIVITKLEAIKSIKSLFEICVRDEEPFRWFPWGDSSRVAAAAYLGRKLGRDPAWLKSTLVPRTGRFKSPPNTSAPTAEEYVDRVIHDADAALAGASG